MRFCKSLVTVAAMALAMLGANVAKADGVDPHAKITVPVDPGYQTCQAVEQQGAECFTSAADEPIEIQGPTLAQVAAGFDIVTNFFYEPDCAAPNSMNPCTAADTLMSLAFYFSNSINGGTYTCTADQSVPNPAFSGCSVTGFIMIDDVPETEALLVCDPTKSACTGMLPGFEGSASVTPEPGTLLLLAGALPLLGLYSWKRRNTLNLGRQNRADLATS
jgi:hypothetical protein